MTIDELRLALQQFRGTSESYSLELRNSVADLLMDLLRFQGLTQKELANRSGIHAKTITEIMHSNTNVSMDTLGKLLHALKTRARIVASPHQDHDFTGMPATAHSDFKYISTATTLEDIEYETKTNQKAEEEDCGGSLDQSGAH